MMKEIENIIEQVAEKYDWDYFIDGNTATLIRTDYFDDGYGLGGYCEIAITLNVDERQRKYSIKITANGYTPEEIEQMMDSEIAKIASFDPFDTTPEETEYVLDILSKYVPISEEQKRKIINKVMADEDVSEEFEEIFSQLPTDVVDEINLLVFLDMVKPAIDGESPSFYMLAYWEIIEELTKLGFREES